MLNVWVKVMLLSATVAPAWPDAPGLSAGALNPCPAEAPGARGSLARFLMGREHAGERSRAGIPQVDLRSVRVLSGSADAQVCETLNRGFEPAASRTQLRQTYFQAGDLFFAAFTRERSPGEPLHAGHFPSVVVFDRGLKPLNLAPANP